MKKESGTDVLSTAIAVVGDNNASFEALRASYYAEKIHLIELSKDLGEKNPDYIAQKEKVDELYKALNSEVQILINGTQDLVSGSAEPLEWARRRGGPSRARGQAAIAADRAVQCARART